MNAPPGKARSYHQDFNPDKIISRQAANELKDLLKVACEASRMDWGKLIPSLFRSCRRKSLPIREFSEYNVLNPWHITTITRFLTDLAIPAILATNPFFPPTGRVRRRMQFP